MERRFQLVDSDFLNGLDYKKELKSEELRKINQGKENQLPFA
jgi:hypothetical protein